MHGARIKVAVVVILNSMWVSLCVSVRVFSIGCNPDTVY